MPTALLTLSPDHAVEAHRRHSRLRGDFPYGASKGPKFVVMGLLVAAALFAMDQIGLSVIFVCLALLPAFLKSIAPRSIGWVVRRRFKQSPYCGAEVRYDFATDAMRTNSPHFEGTSLWPLFTRAARFSDGLLLMQGPDLFHWIPFASLSRESDVAELESLVRSRIADYVVVDSPPPAAVSRGSGGS